MSDLAETCESRLLAIIDRYRPELGDGTIYGMPFARVAGSWWA